MVGVMHNPEILCSQDQGYSLNFIVVAVIRHTPL